jgi:hypothetical protein
MKEHLDTITVGHKFVNDVKFLFECFTVLSKGECFYSLPATANNTVHHKPHKATKTGAKGKTKEKTASAPTVTVFEQLPNWFNHENGGTISQWLCAFLEFVIVKKYAQENYWLGIFKLMVQMLCLWKT